MDIADSSAAFDAVAERVAELRDEAAQHVRRAEQSAELFGEHSGIAQQITDTADRWAPSAGDGITDR